MPRLRLFHRKPSEAGPRIEFLRKAGYEVDYDEKFSTAAFRAAPPQAVLIDLTRMPSHGREVAVYIRGTKSLRHLPIVFVEGDPDKVAALRELIPDATYTSWKSVVKAIKDAIARPPVKPVAPLQMMERYGSRTVAQKLGISSDSVVTVFDPPRNFPSVLGDIPEGVQFEEEMHSQTAVTLWFIHDVATYQSMLGKRRHLAKRSKLWILWPKGDTGKRAGIT